MQPMVIILNSKTISDRIGQLLLIISNNNNISHYKQIDKVLTTAND